MQSYFFLPANRLNKIHDIQKMNIDYLIIDLEDSIKNSERMMYINHLQDLYISSKIYIRVPLYSLDDNLELEFYTQLKNTGYNNFVFPKLKNQIDFEILFENVSLDENIILLVERPLFLIELKEILQKNHTKLKGIGLGSHDLMNFIGSEHSLTSLEYYRNYLLLLAKAFDLIAFDIASMELNDPSLMEKEILNGFKKGFDAKFYIHPWQIEIKDNIQFFTNKDLLWAKKIYKELLKVKSLEEFNPIVVDGQIIEKPHLNKVFAIIKYFKNNESK